MHASVRARAREIADLYPDDETGWDPAYIAHLRSKLRDERAAYAVSWPTALHHARVSRVKVPLVCLMVAYHEVAVEQLGLDGAGNPLSHFLTYFLRVARNYANGRPYEREAAAVAETEDRFASAAEAVYGRGGVVL